jgi:L-rhamnonate dehydratase
MRIRSIEARAVDCGFQRQKLQTSRVAAPMERWPEFAARRASWMWPSKKAFVRVEAEDGTVGWSCTNGGEVVALIVNEHLSGFVAQRTVDDIAEVWDQMVSAQLPHDRSGFAMMAVSGVDIALWDLEARLSGVPLVQRLGGSRHEELKVYATTGQPGELSGDWWGLKAAMPWGVHGGDEGFAANRALMEAFRKAAGGRRIMLDAFMSWNADYTLRFIEANGDLDIYWIEDPLPAWDLEGLRRIRERAGDRVRLALGNFCFSRWDCAELIREGLVDILQPDVAWAGGITEALRILDLAEAADVPVILHNTCEQPWALALAAARQDDPVVEFVDRGGDSPLYALMGPAFDRRDGRVDIPASGNLPPDEVARLFTAPDEAYSR